MSRNGVDSFMKKLPDKDDIVKICNEVLEINPRKRENEDHLCPPEFKQRIEAIVDDLVEGNKVTRSDISLLSCSLKGWILCLPLPFESKTFWDSLLKICTE